MAAADLDSDDLDVVVAHGAASNISPLIGLGNGLFEPEQGSASSSGAIHRGAGARK
jgi:hypothetical protein